MLHNLTILQKLAGIETINVRIYVKLTLIGTPGEPTVGAPHVVASRYLYTAMMSNLKVYLSINLESQQALIYWIFMRRTLYP